MRISVVGVSCSGKTTLARRIAEKKQIPFIEQDNLFWNPGWVMTPRAEFEQRVQRSVAEDAWVTCGNYSETRELIFNRSTHIVWLNYPFTLVAWRALNRTLRRVFLREECCNGNRETFALAFLSKNSILYWVAKTYRYRIEQYRKEEALAEAHSICFLEFRSPHEVENWLRDL